MKGQYYRPELRNIDVELPFGTGPYTRNLGVTHVGTPALDQGIHENGEIHLERSDRDSCHCLSMVARTRGSEHSSCENCSFPGYWKTTLKLHRSVHEDRQGACVLDKTSDPPEFFQWEEA